ncbi:MAG: DUF2961 domain-containing protein, partial [Pirellulaceae bacterium]|nr:DUF2961 domain-containing protein [Pirellulaceae bacterium]
MMTTRLGKPVGLFALGGLVVVVFLVSAAQSQTLRSLTEWEEGRSMRAGSHVGNLDDPHDKANNRDRIGRIEPGKTHVMADLKGPGVITHLWLTFLQEPHAWVRDGAADPQEMLIRIYWDGREKPDVEAPLGDFFANCFGKRMEVISDPVIVEDADSYNCFWQMPFRESARIEIVNQSKKPICLLYYNIDWIKKQSLPEDTMYFCAQYNQQYPTPKEPTKPYLVLDAEGKGYYVGTVMAVRSRSPSWFGEGDELIHIDGEEVPSIRGTGTEDYFLSAWGLKTNSTPYFGVPYLNHPDRIVGQMTCSYRWHVHDPLVFNKSIRVTFETFGWISPDENKEHEAHMWNEREDDFSTVAFWYQVGPTKKFTTVPPAEQRKLPSLERVLVWGKEAMATGKHGPGRTRLQKGKLYLESDGQFLLHPRVVENGWVEYEFEVKEKEPLRLLVELTQADDYGIYQPLLNGVKIGRPIDLYRPTAEGWDLKEFHLMDFWPEPGKYAFRLQCVGKNKDSGGHSIGVNSVRLRERRPRVKAFGYDKDKD